VFRFDRDCRSSVSGKGDSSNKGRWLRRYNRTQSNSDFPDFIDFFSETLVDENPPKDRQIIIDDMPLSTRLYRLQIVIELAKKGVPV
jgi:hypothetical protein